jgi:hypothetical protein
LTSHHHHGIMEAHLDPISEPWPGPPVPPPVLLMTTWGTDGPSYHHGHHDGLPPGLSARSSWAPHDQSRVSSRWSLWSLRLSSARSSSWVFMIITASRWAHLVLPPGPPPGPSSLKCHGSKISNSSASDSR